MAHQTEVPIEGPEPADDGTETWTVGPARWSDIGPVYHLYRGLPEAERIVYHPFPFGTIRLATLLAGLIALRSLLPRMARLFPRGAALLVLARRRKDGALAALGTLNFARPSGRGKFIARTGLYVVPVFRRLGAGRSTNDWMLARARALGAGSAEALIVPRNEASRALFDAMGYRIHPSSIRDRRPPFEPFLLAERSLE